MCWDSLETILWESSYNVFFYIFIMYLTEHGFYVYVLRKYRWVGGIDICPMLTKLIRMNTKSWYQTFLGHQYHYIRSKDGRGFSTQRPLCKSNYSRNSLPISEYTSKNRKNTEKIVIRVLAYVEVIIWRIIKDNNNKKQDLRKKMYVIFIIDI